MRATIKSGSGRAEGTQRPSTPARGTTSCGHLMRPAGRVIDARLGRGNDDLTNPLWSGRNVVRGGPERSDRRPSGRGLCRPALSHLGTGDGVDPRIRDRVGDGRRNGLAGRSADETLVGGRGLTRCWATGAQTNCSEAPGTTGSGGPGSDSGNGGPGRDSCSSIAQRVNCEIVPNRLSSWPAGTHKGLAYGCRRSANRRTCTAAGPGQPGDSFRSSKVLDHVVALGSQIHQAGQASKTWRGFSTCQPGLDLKASAPRHVSETDSDM